MPVKPLKLEPATVEIRKGGRVVGLTDRAYPLNGDEAGEIVVDEVLVRGDLSGRLKYNGREIEIVGVDSIIGLEAGPVGVRGPVWKRVRCKILR